MDAKNPNFYPTPKNLIFKMLSKVNLENCHHILEPSAGDGRILNYIHDLNSYKRCDMIYSAIEIDEDLQKQLRANKVINLIDTDFLNYNGGELFDLIIANFPFDRGDEHLHKALDILYSGELVCLINAETLRNPYSNSRKELVKRLESLNASIEYIESPFVDAIRKTSVDVALVHVKVERKVESDLFNDMDSEEDDLRFEGFGYEVSSSSSIEGLVMAFNNRKSIITESIMNYFKNYNKIKEYISLEVVKFDREDVDRYVDHDELTKIMTQMINSSIKQLKYKFWQEVFQLKEIKSKLTSAKVDELTLLLKQYSSLSFTEENIRQFCMNVVSDYPQMINESIITLFDEWTKYALFEHETEYDKNIHYYNGWKTNKAFKVNKKIILPCYTYNRYSDDCSLKWEHKETLTDIDKVIKYFNPAHPIETADKVSANLKRGQNTNIDTGIFKVSIYKKGTMHITFKDLDVLRLFNITVGKLRNWLPDDYGSRAWNNLNDKERTQVNNFEGKKSYRQLPDNFLNNFIRLDLLS